jgi:hypothetical protein
LIGSLKIALALALLAPVAVTGTVPPVAAHSVGVDEPADLSNEDGLQLERVVTMVSTAHEFLLENQNRDGSFSLLRSERESGSAAPIAVTGLASLSLMASGRLPAGRSVRGSLGRPVQRAVRWLIDRCDEHGEFRADDDTVSKMHGQGYALLALTHAVGMYGNNEPERVRLHGAIERAVQLVDRTQGLQGGWYYDAKRSTHHEGSITVCMIQALRAAKDAGFVVDPDVIKKAEGYMKRSQDKESGRFRYAIGNDRMTWALTAAALATLNAMGNYGSVELNNGFDALRREDPFTGAGRPDMFQLYGAFYAAQSYWAWHDARLFESWWPHFLDYCDKQQRDDGSFSHGKYGKVYATAIVSLTLQVPLGYLPMFQR